ncbi:hypothetical protein KM043_005375 [Ampulex compressa]|nr:hypothetical protein KM043_005375 [Ampulex compressa]
MAIPESRGRFEVLRVGFVWEVTDVNGKRGDSDREDLVCTGLDREVDLELSRRPTSGRRDGPLEPSRPTDAPLPRSFLFGVRTSRDTRSAFRRLPC